MKSHNRLFWLSLCFIRLVLSATLTVPFGYETIQMAVDDSVSGDTILVSPGIYYESISVSGKDVFIISEYALTGDPADIQNTIVDGNQAGSVFLFDSFVTRSAELNGFTLTNGSGTMTCNNCVVEGGGIFCSQGSPTLRNLIITANQLAVIDTVVSRGAGISCTYSSPLIENVHITHNSHSGVYLSNNSSPRFDHVEIIENGNEGLVCSYQSGPRLDHVLIAGNASTGIKCVNSAHPVLLHVTIFDHPAYGITVNHSDMVLVNSIVWNNSPSELFVYNEGVIDLTFTTVQGEMGGVNLMNGALNVHDQLMNVFPSFLNPGFDDFHLQIDSPCINSGTELFVMDGDTLLNSPPETYEGFFPDLGAFEFFSAAGLIGDLSNDGQLNVVDIVLLVSIILENYATNFQLWAGDINPDSLLNVVDIVQLIDEILSQ